MAYTNIDDPSAYFQTALYTGNSSNGFVITNDGNSDLQPDLVWIKKRSGNADHPITDSNRGTSTQVYANLTYQDDPVSGVTAFNTDGFTLGSNGESNLSGSTFAAWQWKANGGTTSSNTDGTITSTVQANTDAGFNIVTYTGNGANSNFGHGMGEQPDMVFVKNRTSAASWCVWHKDLTSSYYLQLNTNISQQTGPWDGLDPNSGVVFVYSGGLVNASGSDYVAYIFKGKQGYSKFGSYVGNGSADGTFVYTGFKPAFVIVKKSSGTGNWLVYDSTRGAFNLNDEYVYANEASAEATSSTSGYDFLSNGFKTRNTYNDGNVSGQTYIYMAFAENPFTTSTGIPTTAR